MEKYLFKKIFYFLNVLIAFSFSLSKASANQDLLNCKTQLLENLSMALSNEELIDIRHPLPEHWQQLGTDQDQIFTEYYNGQFRVYIQEGGSTFVTQVPSSRQTNNDNCKVFGESRNEGNVSFSRGWVSFQTNLVNDLIRIPNSDVTYSMTNNILCSTLEESFRNRGFVPKPGGYKESNLNWSSEVSSSFSRNERRTTEVNNRGQRHAQPIESQEYSEAVNIRLLDLVSIDNYNSEEEVEESIFQINKPLSHLSEEEIDRIQWAINSGLNTARGEGTSCSRLQFSSEIQGSFFSTTGYQRLMAEFSKRSEQRTRDLRRLEISGQCPWLDRMTGQCQHISPPIVR